MLDVKSQRGVRVRTARLEDYDAVAELHRRMAWPVLSAGKWHWLAEDNPARAVMGGVPPGWVLEADGSVGGFFGNIAQRYWLDGAPIAAAAGYSYLALPHHGAASLTLAAAFFRQPAASLLLNTTANDMAGAIYRRFGCEQPPVPSLRSRLHWLLDPRRAVAVAARRFGLGKPLAEAAGLLATAAAPMVRLAGHGPKRPAGPMPDLEKMGQDAVGRPFDRLWRDLAEEPRRLLAWRDAATLRWRLSEPDARIRLIACRSGTGIDGYVLLKVTRSRSLGMVRGRIVDLQVGPAAPPATLDWILWAAALQGQRDGCHVLELYGLPGAPREAFLARRAVDVPWPASPFHYRAKGAELAKALQVPSVWLPSLLDGDGALLS